LKGTQGSSPPGFPDTALFSSRGLARFRFVHEFFPIAGHRSRWIIDVHERDRSANSGCMGCVPIMRPLEIDFRLCMEQCFVAQIAQTHSQ
jgi:hypothetical protein